MKKILCLLLALLCLLNFGTWTAAEAIPEVTVPVTRDVKFGSANMAVTPEEFAAAGFALGDSCDIIFSNGFSCLDIPFYNGYYVKPGTPVVVAYPGFDYVSVAFNSDPIWEPAGLKEGDTVTVILHEAGKYAALQEALGQSYSFDRADYISDAAFCNFRALTGGALKENFLFRGASPVDDSRGRAPYTDALLKENGVVFILDLADSGEDMEGYLKEETFASPYSAALYAEGKIALLSMSAAFRSEDYRQKLAEGLRAMLLSPGPAYIHCMEGKDRTGFVCMLLEALAGASYEEMRTDYMLTYGNYYGVTPEAAPEKYAAIADLYFDAFAAFLHGTEDLAELKAACYTADAEAYLLSSGMTEEEVAALRAYITK